jgi:hypothetical protein
LAALERGALAGRAAVVAGRLDEEPACVAGAGLGDRALPSLLAGAVFGGDEPEVVHQLRGALEAGEVADLGAQSDRGERVDAAQAAQPRDRLGPRRERDELAEQPLDRVAARDQRVDRAQVVEQRRLGGALTELDLRKQGPVGRSPGARAVLVADVVAEQQLAQPVTRPHQIAPDVPRVHERGRATPPPRCLGP